jgi:hypothetical protein
MGQMFANDMPASGAKDIADKEDIHLQNPSMEGLSRAVAAALGSGPPCAKIFRLSTPKAQPNNGRLAVVGFTFVVLVCSAWHKAVVLV